MAAALPLVFTNPATHAFEGSLDPMVDLVNSSESATDNDNLSQREIASLEAVTEAVESLNPDNVTAPWLDAQTGEIVVGIVSEAKGPGVLRSLAAEGHKQVAVEEIEHSQEELDEIVATVYSQPGMETISSAYHDYLRNRVVLTTTETPTDELRRAIYRLYGTAAALESTPSQVTVVNSNNSRLNDRSSLFSGARYYGSYANGGDTTCTTGFAWRGKDGDEFMLTAGHCMPKTRDTEVFTGVSSDRWQYRVGIQFGSTWAANGSGTVGTNGDLAMIKLGSARTASARMWTGGTYTSTSTIVTSVDKWTTNGQAVCYSGIYRGVQCGSGVDDNGDGGYKVTDANASYKATTGAQVNNVALATKGWGNCVVPGESGAPVYINTPGVGVAAHGIVSGSSAGFGSDNYVGKYEPASCKMWFTEIGQAYQQWDGGGYAKTTSQ